MRSTGSTSSRSGRRAATSVAAPWRRDGLRRRRVRHLPRHGAARLRRAPGGLACLAVDGRQRRHGGHAGVPALAVRGRARPRLVRASGVTVSGFVTPFDTWASMSHLVPAEDWPETGPTTDDRLLLQCAGHADARDGTPDVERETRAVRERARIPRPRRRDALAGGGRGRIPLVPAVRQHRPGTRPAPSDSTASTGGRTSTPPTSTSSRCPVPTSTASAGRAPVSTTSPWRATGPTTA